MKKIISLMLVFLMATTACSNLFAPASNKNTDRANYEEALKAIDNSNWDSALDYFALLSAGFMDSRDVKNNYAAALAGKCGFNFLEYFESLQNASIGGSTTLFVFLMNAFTQKVVYPSYCASAEAVMTSISPDPGQRTNGENLFMLLLSMAKMGTYLRDNADVDSTDNLGDGTADGTFNACTDGTAAGEMSDEEVAQFTTGFAQFLINFTVAGAIFSGVSGSVSDITTACTALSLSICSQTDATAVSPAEIKSMRSLIATDPTNPTFPIGVSTCMDPTVTGCCP